MEKLALLVILVLITANCAAEKAPGYRGIWYSNQPSGDEYAFKYSGGLGTYCADHTPLAVYAPQVNKTFFVYGGTKGLSAEKPLLEMIGCYDHATKTISRPTIIMEKGTDDAHHNPTLTIDKDGFLWVFMSSHGGKDGFIYKSLAPYSIEGFERIMQREFTYPQPWYFEGHGFVFLFTRYTGGRESYVSTSPDGINWSEDAKIAGFGGHYQVSWAWKDAARASTPISRGKLGTAFNWHPPVGGLNARTNLYYMETGDFGKAWVNAAGKPLVTPLNAVQNDALVHDYQKDGLLVYINDVNYDSQGRPVIFYNLGKGYESGPKFGMRTMMTARWTGKAWEFRKVTETDHNYDMGSLYIEDDGTWRIIAPTDPGPQTWSTGGEMVMWVTRDKGKSWAKTELTNGSKRNHSYSRKPLNAHPDFYAFWADGNALKPSVSCLYFTSKDGRVTAMPYTMR